MEIPGPSDLMTPNAVFTQDQLFTRGGYRHSFTTEQTEDSARLWRLIESGKSLASSSDIAETPQIARRIIDTSLSVWDEMQEALVSAGITTKALKLLKLSYTLSSENCPWIIDLWTDMNTSTQQGKQGVNPAILFSSDPIYNPNTGQIRTYWNTYVITNNNNQIVDHIRYVMGYGEIF